MRLKTSLASGNLSRSVTFLQSTSRTPRSPPPPPPRSAFASHRPLLTALLSGRVSLKVKRAKSRCKFSLLFLP